MVPKQWEALELHKFAEGKVRSCSGGGERKEVNKTLRITCFILPVAAEQFEGKTV